MHLFNVNSNINYLFIFFRNFFILLFFLIFSYSNVLAVEEFPIYTTIFGTLGFAKSDYSDAYFRSRLDQSKGADSEWSHDVDTNLGIQFSYEPSKNYAATVQFITEQDVDGRYDPKIEWGYVTFSPLEELKLRLGRTVFPTFMASDYVNVGFTYLPVRLPHDVYSLVPFSGIDGINLIYQKNIAGNFFEVNAIAGKRDFKLYNEGIDETDYELDDGLGLRISLTRGGWTLSAGYFKGEMKVDAPELEILIPALNSAGSLYPPFATLANELSDEGKTSFSSFGFRYNGFRFTFSGEYVQRRWDINMNVSDTDAYYLLAGYHFGNLTPYAFYSRSLNKSNIPLDTYPKIGEFSPLSNAVNDLFGPLMGNGSTKSIGIRYDILDNLCIKAQYEKINRGASTFISKNGKLQPEEIDLISFALSFVYQ